MEGSRTRVAIVLMVLVGVACLFSGPTQAESSSSAAKTDQSSMETIRAAVNHPEVTEKLKARGYSQDDIERRLALLESSLTGNQKRYLARHLAPANSPTSRRQLPGGHGNQFLGTTLDLVTSIILLPVKIVAWFIPGL